MARQKTNGEMRRPFRIWHESVKANLPHRYYETEDRAHAAARAQIWWEQPGEVFTVYDARKEAWRGSYKRTIKGLEIATRKQAEDKI